MEDYVVFEGESLQLLYELSSSKLGNWKTIIEINNVLEIINGFAEQNSTGRFVINFENHLKFRGKNMLVEKKNW